MRCCRMQRFTSADAAPKASKEARALEVLSIARGDTLTTRILQEARKVALLQNHPDKCGNPRVSCDDILLAFDTLNSFAAAGGQEQALEEERNGHIKATYGEFFCDPNCNECSSTASAAFFCRGCTKANAHSEACALKKERPHSSTSPAMKAMARPPCGWPE